MIFGYVRFTKGENQNIDLQVESLKKHGANKIFIEQASGGRWERPELQRMIEHLREGDIVLVWKLDRLSPSLEDLLIIIDKIEQKESGFKSITEAIDTTSPAGRMMMQMIGSLAECSEMLDSAAKQRGMPKAAKNRIIDNDAEYGGYTIQLSATNEESESSRLARLERVVGYVCALDERILAQVEALHDHKGQLLVAWKDYPSDDQKNHFSQAWSSRIGDGVPNVEHTTDRYSF